MSETALGKKKVIPLPRESAFRDSFLHSFISRFEGVINVASPMKKGREMDILQIRQISLRIFMLGCTSIMC